jgi:hypothetical protein
MEGHGKEPPRDKSSSVPVAHLEDLATQYPGSCWFSEIFRDFCKLAVIVPPTVSIQHGVDIFDKLRGLHAFTETLPPSQCAVYSLPARLACEAAHRTGGG